MKPLKHKRTLKQYCKKMKVSSDCIGRDEKSDLIWAYRGSFKTWNCTFFTTPGYKTEEEAQAAIDRGDVDTQFINEPMI